MAGALSTPDPRADPPTGAAPTGQVWSRTVAPHAIDAGLRDLWCDVARSGSDVARALMSNLIVYGHTASPASVGDEIAEVARQHPSRIIVVHEHPGASTPEPSTEVRITAFGDTHTRIGVEEIVVTVGSGMASLASLLRRLVLGELPTTIWWAGPDPPRRQAIQDLIPLARQFVYDSFDWAHPVEPCGDLASFIAHGDSGIGLGDLAWRRLEPFKRALIQAVDPAVVSTAIGDIGAVRIHSSAGNLSAGWLLAGWLATRLHWNVSRIPVADPAHATLSFHGAGRDVRVSIDADTGPDELTIEIDADADPGSPALTVSRTSDEIAVRYGLPVPPFRLAVPRLRRADLLATELRSFEVDRNLHDAVTFIGALARL